MKKIKRTLLFTVLLFAFGLFTLNSCGNEESDADASDENTEQSSEEDAEHPHDDAEHPHDDAEHPEGEDTEHPS